MNLKGKNFLVSVLVPFKNEAQYLADSLSSLAANISCNIEVIMVNDYSSDSSHAIAKEFEESDTRFRLFENEGKGLISALRTAFKHSTGSHISRMDADDRAHPEKYKLMLELWTENSVVCGHVQYFSDDVLRDGYKRYAKWINKGLSDQNPWQHLYQECIIPSPSWLMSRVDLERIGGICAGIYPEDYELAFRMKRHGLIVVATDEIVHFWRDHSARNSRTNPLYSNNFFPEIKAKNFLENELDESNELLVIGAGSKAKELIRAFQSFGGNPRWLTNNPQKIGHNIYGIILEDESNFKFLATHKIAIAISNEKERNDLENVLLSQNLVPGENYWFFC